MKGIKMSDCKFYINEEARTIICVISGTREMLDEYIIDNCLFDDFDLSAYWGHLRTKLKMPSSFIGKAVCAPEDEWDEELGRMIAFSRAKDKCYKSFFKRANTYVQTIDLRLNEIITKFNDFGVKLEDKRVALQKKIDDKMGLNIDE